jgi:hypothetical protein
MHSNGPNAYKYNVQMNVHAEIADSSADCCESRDRRGIDPNFISECECGHVGEGGNAQ